MWPCNWTLIPSIFEKDDIIFFTDKMINTSDQLKIFANITQYVLGIGGTISADYCTIDGSLFEPNTTDFYLEISPFNESALYGFHFINFKNPVLSLRGMEFFLIGNCSWCECNIAYDYPLISLCNVSCIMANSSLINNSVEGTSLIGLYTAILGFFESQIIDNIQLSRGPIPLVEFTNGAAEITNSTISHNISPNSPLFGSWYFLIAVLQNSTIESNFCGNSGLIIGDSIANVSFSNSSVFNNRGALLHSMALSELNCDNLNFSFNFAAGQSLVFAPRSKIRFINQTTFSNNIALSMLSSQLTNKTSLEINSTVFANNTNTDTGFALDNSVSLIENATISGNTIFSHAFLSLNSSNFSITKAHFEKNWASQVIDVIDSSIDVKQSLFEFNKGDQCGVFDLTISKEQLFFHFIESNFSDNFGNNVSSVLFKKMIPPSRFEYCKFKTKRFNEVNGDLDKEQLFHRCRFENAPTFISRVPTKKHILSPFFCFYSIYLTIMIVGLIVYFKLSSSTPTPEIIL